MKRLIFLSILFSLFSCEDSVFRGDCPEVVKGYPGTHLIKDPDLSTAKSLLRVNGISIENLVISRYQLDDLGHKHISCYQYLNDLVIFTETAGFHFDRMNKFYFQMGDLISAIDVSTNPQMDKEKVISVFLDNIEKDSFRRKSLAEYEKGCFRCELGYYDLNAGTSYAPHNFVLAWKITPEDSDYPVAYFRDTDESLIYYFNGVIID